ncbi:hypothetical protein [Methylobacterium sp. BTF04]|uniref:hypothetical protein n=1 Tax=Methylobacterium sp. BTF04 TaxID=2708300 RepID=UPI0032B1828E
MTALPPLDRDRFAKCRMLMARGATPGERAAGEAAATRVAAAAGLTLRQAQALVDGRPAPGAAPRPPPTHAWAEPKPKPPPVSVEELRAQKLAAEARQRKMAEREERRLRAVYAEQARHSARERAAQADRDREWAEARARRGT